MSLFAASKYFLEIREVKHADRPDTYVYSTTRNGAVDYLIERETKAVAQLSKQLTQRKARLRAFIKKERGE